MSEVEPTDDEVRVMLEAGVLLRDIGRLDAADAIFRGLLELLPEWPVVPRLELSSVELQRGRPAEAESLCVEALRLRPEHPYARLCYAEVLLYQKKRREAEKELQRLISSDPESEHSETARSWLAALNDINGPLDTTAKGSI
ncbi:MAG TPA: tetratricopeptide repeat protein [Pyrinomonadaceae bacterium]|nr:tetratricopeptide repeat protein [Pyrinomonadaceae bacterium]